MEWGTGSRGEAPACLRPPCRAQGTLLLSAQLQLVTHLRAGLGGVRDKSRTLKGIFPPEEIQKSEEDTGVLPSSPSYLTAPYPFSEPGRRIP